MMGFEMVFQLECCEVQLIKVSVNGQLLLWLKLGNFEFDVVVIIDWGGYVLNLYVVFFMDIVEQVCWVVQLIEFLCCVLVLLDMLIFDVIFENGCWFMFVYVDGDGFVLCVEFFGFEYFGEVLLQDVWEKYCILIMLLIIEGEVGVSGFYFKLMLCLEVIVCQMFVLLYVELGIYIYLYLFDWSCIVFGVVVDWVKEGLGVDKGGGDIVFMLFILGYKFSLDCEIVGLINYINECLVLFGKCVKFLQWLGDCQFLGIVVCMVWDVGVFNLNGGDIIIMCSLLLWMEIVLLGIDKGLGVYQVFVLNQNENVYINDWIGLFYGFDCLIEMLQLMDMLYCFKLINIYYYMYLGIKFVLFKVLKKVYDYVLLQFVFLIYLIEYVVKVLDFCNMVIV